jgi:hypothetical protein
MNWRSTDAHLSSPGFRPGAPELYLRERGGRATSNPVWLA